MAISYIDIDVRCATKTNQTCYTQHTALQQQHAAAAAMQLDSDPKP